MKPWIIFRPILLVSMLLSSALFLLAAPDDHKSPIDATISLADAVNVFNRKAADDPIGKNQPALTEDAVIAAIRWAMLDRNKLLVTDDTFQALSKIITTHTLPKGFDLENLTGYEPNDQVAFEVWSVRLRIPGGTSPNGTTCIMVHETMIRSRIIGEEELKVIRAWQKKWQEQGGVVLSEGTSYSKERAEPPRLMAKTISEPELLIKRFLG